MSKLPTYLRLGEIDLETVFAQMDSDDETIITDTFTYKISSRRLPVYKTKGVECKCGRRGTFFAAEVFHRDTRVKDWKAADKPGTPPRAHLNLYGNDPDGTEFMMTVDHHIPKSKGGSDTLDNKEPMCRACNVKKSDTMPT